MRTSFAQHSTSAPKSATSSQENWSVVFRNKYGAVLQSDRRNRLRIEFGNQSCELKFIHFFSLKKQADQVNIHQRLFDLSPEADSIPLSSCGIGLSFRLSLLELLALRELLQGTRVMLELNSLLRENAIQYPTRQELVA